MSTEHSSLAIANQPKPGKKYFSLSEANRALVYVQPITEQMCASYGQVMAVRRHLEQCAVHEKEAMEVDLERIMDQLTELVDELNYVGVEIKDFEKGLIDFPAVHEGREIYLCWHLGESAVETWHEIDAGYTGRQDVTNLEAA